MVSSATAYSIYMKVQDLHASKSEECEKEGTNFSFHANLSQKRLDISRLFLVSLCASLRSAHDHLARLWLRCDFSTLCNAKILFHTRANTFCICISHVVNNMASKFHLSTTCGRCEMKPYSCIWTNESKISHQNLDFPSTLNNGRCIIISATGVNQKPNYNCLKFSEPFTKLQVGSVKGSKHFQRLYLAFCLTPSIQISTKYP